MDMQKFIDDFSSKMETERAESQMTLGKLIDQLDNMPANELIENINNPMSYRGYYSDLAFQKNGYTTVKNLYDMLIKECLGVTFIGYKGGEFRMNVNTPLWIADYGDVGVKIIALTNAGEFITEEDNN